jgi:hypothetical protein
MVQFRTQNGLELLQSLEAVMAADARDYWKLKDPNARLLGSGYVLQSNPDLKRSLDKQQYARKTNYSRERLLELQTRANRGLISYEKCKVQDGKKQRTTETLIALSEY